MTQEQITKKAFSFGDQNEATLGLKIAGYLISIAGATIIMAQLGTVPNCPFAQFGTPLKNS